MQIELEDKQLDLLLESIMKLFDVINNNQKKVFCSAATFFWQYPRGRNIQNLEMNSFYVFDKYRYKSVLVNN